MAEKKQEDLIGPFVSPAVVRAEIRKTKAFVDDLSNEVIDAQTRNPTALTDEQKKWLASYWEWKDRFDDWAKENLNETWNPLQVAATSAIASQNDAWKKEAEEKQSQFKALGFPSKATPPPPSPGAKGSSSGGELGTFLSGMGAGTILLLVVGAYLLSDSGKRRR
jgi:hypothetical protein